MSYAVEFIKFQDGHAEPRVVERIDGPFSTTEEANTQAVIAFATFQAAREVIGYRIVSGGGEVLTTKVWGIG